MLPHLLFTGLPGAYKGTSPYALLPFYTPKAVAGILKGNKAIDQYDTRRNRSDGGIIAVHTQAGCKQVFEDEQTFRAISPLDNTNFLPKVFFTEGLEAKVSKFFRENVGRSIKESSLRYNGSKRSVDIVRDVTNVVPIMWLAQHFAIPLKTLKTPKGLVTLPQLFDMYMVIFMYQNFNILPINEWKLRDGYQKAEPVLRGIFEAHLNTQQGMKETIVDWLAKGSAYEVGPDADRLYHALNDSKLPMRDLVSDCIGLGAPVAGVVTQQASLLIAFYLRSDNAQHKESIVKLAHQNDAASETLLQGYVLEGMRHAGVIPGLPRIATKDTTIQDGTHGPVHVKQGQTVLIATSSSSQDASAFPNPETIDPTRPTESYFLLRSGLHADFGSKLVLPALAATLREVFKLKNVRSAPGKRGMFTTTKHVVAGVTLTNYLDDNARESPFPTSLTVEYDE
jgi:cytochrome P450